MKHLFILLFFLCYNICYAVPTETPTSTDICSPTATCTPEGNGDGGNNTVTPLVTVTGTINPTSTTLPTKTLNTTPTQATTPIIIKRQRANSGRNDPNSIPLELIVDVQPKTIYIEDIYNLILININLQWSHEVVNDLSSTNLSIGLATSIRSLNKNDDYEILDVFFNSNYAMALIGLKYHSSGVVFVDINYNNQLERYDSILLRSKNVTTYGLPFPRKEFNRKILTE